MPNLFVKICGITSQEDAELAIESGANALGFIFHPDSPRYVEPHEIKKWIGTLPKSIRKVGVFVDHSFKQIDTIMEETQLDWIQYHCPITEQLPESYAGRYIHVRSIKNEEKMLQLNLKTKPVALLLDTQKGTQYGGTGESFNWQLIDTIQTQVDIPIWIAGGLSIANIPTLLTQYRIDGIDLSSSLEKKPGKKDPQKCKRFSEWLADYRTIND